MITLQSLPLPSPAALSVKTALRGGTAQYNTLGELVQDGMKEKRTVEISWRSLPSSALGQLAEALSGGFLQCTYPDPLLGTRTMSCQCTQHCARVYRVQDGAAQWADVSVTLEEQ